MKQSHFFAHLSRLKLIKPLAANAQRADGKCVRTQFAGSDGRPCAGSYQKS